MENRFNERLWAIKEKYEQLIEADNEILEENNGIFQRCKYPILTAAHIPYFWKYDLNPNSNPFLMERIGFNATFNAGAIKLNDKFYLVVRVEDSSRKSFFAIAESSNGIGNFRFWDYPISFPAIDEQETNVYDMRLVQHEDGWIYGLFCSERRDPSVPVSDQSSAIAQCGIVRTKDLQQWERLPDLVTPSAQQRNVVLHPEFVDSQYAFYTRPQDGFIDAGKGGGIGFGLAADITHAVIEKEVVIDKRVYHTVYEAKNGLGPAPIKTAEGWLHLAHGVRNTAAGLRYVLYMFMTSLNDITLITHKPAGYFIAPEGGERIGDVSNVVFSNGWVLDDDGKVYIYYASSDTRMHVAISSVEQLVDYVLNTASDGYTFEKSINQITQLVDRNAPFMQSKAVLQQA